MVFELTVEDNEEFEEMIKSHDINISRALVEVILKNLKGKKRYIHALSVSILKEASTYNITIDRKDFTTTLLKQLKSFENVEEYETCAEIMGAVKYLEEKGK